MTFNFSTNTKPLFGSTNTSTTGSGFSSFSAPSTNNTSSFGFGLGNTSTSTSNTFGNPLSFGAKTSTGFGQNTTSQSVPSFSFGSATTTTAQSNTAFSFGTSTAPSFSFGGAPNTSTTTTKPLFGNQTTVAPFSFGTGQSNFSQPQQQQQQQISQQDESQALLQAQATAIAAPQIFSDERDEIISKWNQILAFFGTGKAFYGNSGSNCVRFHSENPWCRFKAVNYVRMSQYSDSDGLVSLTIDKKHAEVKQYQQQIVDSIHKILGGNISHSVFVSNLLPMPSDKTELTIFIQERNQTGDVRKIPSQELHNYLEQNNIKQQLTKQLCISNIVAKRRLNKNELKEYLSKPAAGIDPVIWQQAKLDNPDPENLIPMPMLGFSALKNRLDWQQQQVETHQIYIDNAKEILDEIQKEDVEIVAKIEEFRRKLNENRMRILRIIVSQEVYRKQGFAVQSEEEQFRLKFEHLLTQLNSPSHFKGRLNEIMSHLRMQQELTNYKSNPTYSLNSSVKDDILQHLKQQQDGLEHLSKIVKDDTDSLKILETSLNGPNTD